MGQFSWLDCISGKPIKNNVPKKAYLLIPKQFGGGHIATECYNGYGSFGGYDVYAFIASCNHGVISEEMLGPAPERSRYGGLYFFEKDEMRKKGMSKEEITAIEEAKRDKYYGEALKRHNIRLERIRDYKVLDDDEMAEKYGDDYERNIGIDIACGNKKNKALPFPIKITYDENAVYEDCKYSKVDPKQGC